MTNDNLKRAIRAYMADHGVNYTTARRTIMNASAEGDPVPYGHPDWTPPNTTWELLRDLADASNSAADADEATRTITDALIHEQARHCKPFLADLINRLDPDTATLLDQPSVLTSMREALEEGFGAYWDEATDDDGYHAAATIDIAAGVFTYIDPTRGHVPARFAHSHPGRALTPAEVHRLENPTPDDITRSTTRTREIVHATSETLLAQPAIAKNQRMIETARQLDPDARAFYIFVTVAGFSADLFGDVLDLDREDLLRSEAEVHRVLTR